MSDEDESLASVLGGSSAFHDPVKPQPVVAQESEVKPEVKPAVEETTPQVRDDGGKFAKVVTDQQVEPKVAKPDETQPHVAAIIDERRKRQALEREIAELKQRVPQDQPKPPPSIWEDEEAAISHRVEAATGPLRAVLIDQSVNLAKLIHKDDWQDAEDAFFEAVNANPDLAKQFRSAQNPGEFVYQAGVYHREMSRYGGSLAAMRDAIRGESTAKLTEAQARVQALEKELSDLKASKVEADSLPKSLNSRASSAVTVETDTDDDDLKSIVLFGNKRG